MQFIALNNLNKFCEVVYSTLTQNVISVSNLYIFKIHKNTMLLCLLILYKQLIQSMIP